MADFDPVGTLPFFRERHRIESRITGSVFSALPSGSLSYAPHPSSSTVGATAWTIVRCLRVCNQLTEAKMADVPHDSHPDLDGIISAFQKESGALDEKLLKLEQRDWNERKSVTREWPGVADTAFRPNPLPVSCGCDTSSRTAFDLPSSARGESPIDRTNVRTDKYGGPIQNRMRFLMEILEGTAAAIGPDRMGVRLSPFGQYGGIHDSNPLGLFTSTIQELSGRGLAYLHLIEGRGSEIGLGDALHEDALNNARLFRPHFDGVLLSRLVFKAIELRNERGRAETEC